MFDPPEELTYGQIPPQVQAYLKMPGVNQEKVMQWFNLGLSEPQTFNQAVLLAQAVGYTPEQSKVVAAQWQKESGGGAHVGAAYNYFGIKAHNQAVREALIARGINVGAGAETETKEVEGGKTKSQQSSFMQFNNAFEAFAGHKAFLETNQRYQGALAAETAKDFAIGLQKAGYATDPNYGTSLYNDYVAPKERNPASGDKRPKSLGVPSSSKDGVAPAMTIAPDTAPMKLPIIAPQNIMPRPEFSTDPTVGTAQYGATEFQQEVQPTAPIPMGAPAGYFGGDKTGFRMGGNMYPSGGPFNTMTNEEAMRYYNLGPTANPDGQTFRTGGNMYPYGGNLSSAQLLQDAAGKKDPVKSAERLLTQEKIKRTRKLLNPNAWRFEYSPLTANYSDYITSLGHEARIFTPNLFPKSSGSKTKKIDATFPFSVRAFQDYTDNSRAYNKNPGKFEIPGEYVNLGTDPYTGIPNFVPFERGIRDKNLGVEGKIGFHGLLGSAGYGPGAAAYLDAYGGYSTRDKFNFGVDPGLKFLYGKQLSGNGQKGSLNTSFSVSTPWRLRTAEPYYLLHDYAPNVDLDALNVPYGAQNPQIHRPQGGTGFFQWGPKVAGSVQYTPITGKMKGATIGLRGDAFLDYVNGKHSYRKLNAAENQAIVTTNDKIDVRGVKQVPYVNTELYMSYPIAGAAAHINVAKAKANLQKAKDDAIFEQNQSNTPPMQTTPMTDTRTQGVDFNYKPQEKPETTGTPVGYLPGFNPTTGAPVGANYSQEQYNQGPVALPENQGFEYGGQLGTNMTNMYNDGGWPYTMGGNMYAEGGSFNNPGFNALPVGVQNKIRANSFAVGGGLGSPGQPMLPESAQNIINNPPNFSGMPIEPKEKFNFSLVPEGQERRVEGLQSQRQMARKGFFRNPTVYPGGKIAAIGENILHGIKTLPQTLAYPFLEKNAQNDMQQVNRLTYNPYREYRRKYSMFNNTDTNNFAEGGPLTEFNAGGTHEQNPLGGIPQGMAPDGRPNLVEQGETKLDAANYIFSDNIKVTKETAEQFNLPKTDIGRTFADVSKKLNRPNSRRETDSIENVAKERQLQGLMEAQETQKEMELQKDIQMMTEKHPQFMEALMQQQSVQPMGMPQAPPPEAMAEQMPPEGMPMDPNQIPPEMLAQMEGAQQGMPVMRMGGGMYKCGGKMYNFGGSMYANGGHMYNPGGPLLGGATTGSGYSQVTNPWAMNNPNPMYDMLHRYDYNQSVNPVYNLNTPLNTTPTIGVQGVTDGLAESIEPTDSTGNSLMGKAGTGLGIATTLGQGALQAYGTSQQKGLTDKQKAEQYAQTGVDTGMGVVGSIFPIVGAAYGIGKGIGNLTDKIGEGKDEVVTSADGTVSAVRHNNEGAQVVGDVLSNMFNPGQNVAQGMGYLADKDYKKAAMTFLAPLGGAQIARSLDRKEDNKRAEQIEKMNRGPQVSRLGMPIEDMPVTEDQMPLAYKYGGMMGAHSYDNGGNYLNTDLDNNKADIRSIAPFGSGIADLAPMAYNLYQGLSPYDEVQPEDLYTPIEAIRPDYTQAENQARQSYARMVNALGASGASGGQRLAAQLAGSQAMSNDLMNVMSAEENAYRQAVAEANKYNAAARTQAMMSAMDANWKMKNAKQELLKEAITAPKDKYDQMRRDAVALQYAQLGAPDISRNIQVGEVPFINFAYDKYKKKKAARKEEKK